MSQSEISACSGVTVCCGVHPSGPCGLSGTAGPHQLDRAPQESKEGRQLHCGHLLPGGAAHVRAQGSKGGWVVAVHAPLACPSLRPQGWGVVAVHAPLACPSLRPQGWGVVAVHAPLACPSLRPQGWGVVAVHRRTTCKSEPEVPRGWGGGRAPTHHFISVK